MARVAVIGPNIAKNLFGDDGPPRQSRQINNIYFRVVGVLQPKATMASITPTTRP